MFVPFVEKGLRVAAADEVAALTDQVAIGALEAFTSHDVIGTPEEVVAPVCDTLAAQGFRFLSPIFELGHSEDSRDKDFGWHCDPQTGLTGAAVDAVNIHFTTTGESHQKFVEPTPHLMNLCRKGDDKILPMSFRL